MSDFDNSSLTEVPTPATGDALQFELGGYQIGWRLDGLALQRASDRGVELGDILQGLFELQAAAEEIEDVDEDTDVENIDKERLQQRVSDLTATAAKLIWIGAIRFEPSIPLEAILALVEPDLDGIPLGEMVERALPAIEDEVEGEGK